MAKTHRDWTNNRRAPETVIVKIENDYSDEHHSEHTVELPAPTTELDEWWEDVVFPHTGDGHGIDFDGGSCYTATVIDGDRKALVGATHEWID